LIAKKSKDYKEGCFMKKNGFVVSVLAVMVVCLLGACVSLEDRMLSPQEREEAQIIGSVTTTFSSFQFFYIPNKTSLKKKAYAELKKRAAQEYGGNVDIKNITITGEFSKLEIINIVAAVAMTVPGAILVAQPDPTNNENPLDWFQYYYLGSAYESQYKKDLQHVQGLRTAGGALLGVGGASLLIGNFQKITATGDVVQLNAETGAKQALQRALSGVMENVSLQLIENLPQKSAIAVLSIGSNDKALSENAVEELEFNLVNSGKFTIVDRARLDQIRREQNFQLSGEVSDDSAVSIGNMLGANVVLVGTISTTGSKGRITIRALDVKTAQIVTMARGQF
jgi:TolB-like protein